MINFFAIVLIVFIGILLQIFKKRIFKKLINKSNLYSIKLNKKNFHLIIIVFYTITKKKSTQYFIKILKEIKRLVFSRVKRK